MGLAPNPHRANMEARRLMCDIDGASPGDEDTANTEAPTSGAAL
jgi:hypothetical protein